MPGPAQQSPAPLPSLRGWSLAMALAVPFLWGINVVAVKIGALQIPPLFLLALRFLIVAGLTLPFARPPRWEAFGSLAAVSITLGVGSFGLLFLGVARADVSSVAIAGQLGAPFSTALAVILFRERLGWRRIVGMALAFAGVVVLAGAPRSAGNLAGLGLVVASSVAWAVANILLKRYGPFDTLKLTAWGAVCTAPPLLLLSALFEHGQVAALGQASPTAWGALAFIAIGSSIVAYGFWYYLLNRFAVSQVVPFALLSPVFSVLAGVAVLGDRLTSPILVGGLMTIAGVSLIELRLSYRGRLFPALRT